MNIIVNSNCSFFKEGVIKLIEEHRLNLRDYSVIFDYGKHGVMLFSCENIPLHCKNTPNLSSLLLSLSSGLFLNKTDLHLLLKGYSAILFNRRNTKLNDMECIVLFFLLNQFRPKDIASILNISIKTVSMHKVTSLKKLNISSIALLSLIFSDFMAFTESNEYTSHIRYKKNGVFMNKDAISLKALRAREVSYFI